MSFVNKGYFSLAIEITPKRYGQVRCVPPPDPSSVSKGSKKKTIEFPLPTGIKLISNDFTNPVKEIHFTWLLSEDGADDKVMEFSEEDKEEESISQLDLYHQWNDKLKPLYSQVLEHYKLQLQNTSEFSGYTFKVVTYSKEIKMSLEPVKEGQAEWNEMDLKRMNDLKEGHIIVSLDYFWFIKNAEKKEVVIGPKFRLCKNIYSPATEKPVTGKRKTKEGKEEDSEEEKKGKTEKEA